MHPTQRWPFGVAGTWLLSAWACGQPVVWLEQFGTTASDWPTALAPDAGGGVYVAGRTGGSLEGQNAGANDAFLARYDEAGHRIWIRQLGTSAADSATALASDGVGGVFIAGTTGGAMDGQHSGSDDVFIARYDAEGILVWLRQFGTTAADGPTALCPDGVGGAYIAGSTAGNLAGPNAGSLDGFVARYSAAGIPVWIKQFGTGAEDYPNALAGDDAGGVYVEGYTYGALGGDHTGDMDVFLARYEGTGGEQEWAKQFGTGTYDRGNAIAPDGQGGVFIVGYTRGDLGGPSAGSDDIFLTRYTPAGDRQWIEQFGTSESDFTTALSADGDGGVFIGGGSWACLGGGYVGGVDSLTARYDASGSREWIIELGTAANEFANASAPDGTGGIYISGYTYGSLGGPNAGADDVFLVRYGGDACFPTDCDHSCSVNLFDFLCFVNEFNADDPYADCTGDGSLDLFDFLCFVNAFNNGC